MLCLIIGLSEILLLSQKLIYIISIINIVNNVVMFNGFVKTTKNINKQVKRMLPLKITPFWVTDNKLCLYLYIYGD